MAHENENPLARRPDLVRVVGNLLSTGQKVTGHVAQQRWMHGALALVGAIAGPDADPKLADAAAHEAAVEALKRGMGMK